MTLCSTQHGPHLAARGDEVGVVAPKAGADDEAAMAAPLHLVLHGGLGGHAHHLPCIACTCRETVGPRWPGQCLLRSWVACIMEALLSTASRIDGGLGGWG